MGLKIAVASNGVAFGLRSAVAMVWRINWRRCTLSQVLARAMLVSDKLRLALLAAWNRVGGSGRAERRRAQAQERASEQQVRQASSARDRDTWMLLLESSNQPASQPANNKQPHFAHVLLLWFLSLATRSTSRPLFSQLAGSYSYTHARPLSHTPTARARLWRRTSGPRLVYHSPRCICLRRFDSQW